MNKVELIKAIEGIRENLGQVIEVLNGGEVAEATSKEAVKNSKPVKTEKAKTKVEEEDEEEGTTSSYSKEDLDAMKYNDLKKLGASLGVKCVGTRDEITDRILNAGASEEDDEEEAVEDKKVTPISKGKAKASKKEEVVEPEEEEDEVDYLAQAKAIAEESEVEDIIEALKEVKVKATKKNYIEKLAEALEKGLIEAEDDEEGADADDTEDEEEEITKDSYFEEYDPEGINDPENMTKKRAKAIQKMVAKVLEEIENEEIGEDEITEFIETVASEEEKEEFPEDYTENQLIGFYLELRKRLIDDEGAENETGSPYELNEENFCCGHKLKYVKKGNKFICEKCGEEYGVED